jgi:hypothetical protein
MTKFIYHKDKSVSPIYDIIPSFCILYHPKKYKIEINLNWFNILIGIEMLWK